MWLTGKRAGWPRGGDVRFLQKMLEVPGSVRIWKILEATLKYGLRVRANWAVDAAENVNVQTIAVSITRIVSFSIFTCSELGFGSKIKIKLTPAYLGP